MPEKIQFWSKTDPDYLEWETYDGRRLDFLHPVMWFDNQPGKYNVIAHPDIASYAGYVGQAANVAVMDMNKIPWEEKKSIAFFHGSLTGVLYDENGEYLNRLKLIHLAEQNPNLIHAGISKFIKEAGLKYEDIPKSYKPDRYNAKYKELPKTTDYKYMINIDGNVSAWGRGAQILYSDSVLLAVDSKHEPLYQRSWVPWIHYVPIKNDLSDLVENIEWLKQNDEKA